MTRTQHTPTGEVFIYNREVVDLLISIEGYRAEGSVSGLKGGGSSRMGMVLAQSPSSIVEGSGFKICW